MSDPAVHTRSENNGVTAESARFQTFLLLLTSHFTHCEKSMNKLLRCLAWNLVLLSHNTHRSEEMEPSILTQKEDDVVCF